MRFDSCIVLVRYKAEIKSEKELYANRPIRGVIGKDRPLTGRK